MNAAVQIRDVAVAYGANVILQNMSFEVGKGEFLVLLGPSGCGKSTLLNVIAGLAELTDGEIWIGRRNVSWEEPSSRGIGMVFQSYALYPRMTVKQNLSFALECARLPKVEIEERVARAATMLQLQPLLNRRPAELSGGQRQRVAIGRALVRNVDVFLFDEPLSNLDAKLRGELRVEIKKLHQTLGNTMIYVTHDQVEALTLADRIAVMCDGRIEQLDTPEAIYHKPASLYVAGFVGSPPMSFIEGTLEIADEHPMFRTGSIAIDVAGYSFSGKSEPCAAVLGVRPESISLGAPDQGQFQGVVSLVEPMGADTIVWTEFGGTPISIRTGSRSPLKLGDRVGFSLDAANLSLFAKGDGRRL